MIVIALEYYCTLYPFFFYEKLPVGVSQPSLAFFVTIALQFFAIMATTVATTVSRYFCYQFLSKVYLYYVCNTFNLISEFLYVCSFSKKNVYRFDSYSNFRGKGVWLRKYFLASFI